VPDRLFHYTTSEFALECAADMDAGRPLFVEVWDGLFGPGFYALDIGFGVMSREDLRWECFGDARQEHPMDGVLVLDPVLADVPFERVERHIWMMEASWASRAPIEGMVVAVAVWQGDAWRIVEEYA
jgi:hypothetical protein